MSEKRKCKSCGEIFESDEEARKHKCSNMISTDKTGVWNPNAGNKKQEVRK